MFNFEIILKKNIKKKCALIVLGEKMEFKDFFKTTKGLAITAAVVIVIILAFLWYAGYLGF